MKNYLDIDVFADAMLCDIHFKVPYIGELIRDTDCPAVEDYNDFAEALEDVWQQDGALLTYAAVLEAERPDTLRGAYELLRNLDNYQRIVEGAYGYGQQRLQETLGLDDEAIYELEGYMDFEKYGQDCMENDCVTETEFGLLRRLDPPFPEQRQGQRMISPRCSPTGASPVIPCRRAGTAMTFAALTMIPVSCVTWKKMLWSTTQARC